MKKRNTKVVPIFKQKENLQIKNIEEGSIELILSLKEGTEKDISEIDEKLKLLNDEIKRLGNQKKENVIRFNSSIQGILMVSNMAQGGGRKDVIRGIDLLNKNFTVMISED